MGFLHHLYVALFPIFCCWLDYVIVLLLPVPILPAVASSSFGVQLDLESVHYSVSAAEDVVGGGGGHRVAVDAVSLELR